MDLQTIKLCVRVTREAAIREGTGREGTVSVPLSPEVLGALSADERVLLARALEPKSDRDGRNWHELRGLYSDNPYSSCLTMPGVDTSTAAVIAALRERLGVISAKRAELIRRAEAEGPRLVAGYDNTARWEPGNIREGFMAASKMRFGEAVTLLQRDEPEHPLVVAAREAAEVQAAANRAAWRRWFLAESTARDGVAALVVDDAETRAKRDEHNATLAREKAAAQERSDADALRAEQEKAEKAAAHAARIEAFAKAAREYAEGVTQLRAASQRAGYDLRGAVMLHLAERVAAEMRRGKGTSVVIGVQKTEAWDAIERGDDLMMPTPTQVERHVVIAAAVDAIKMPQGIELMVSQLERLRLAAGEDKVDGMLVALNAPGMREVLIACEVPER